jgi:hemolysin activation/secretion protein/AraC-like DNA-binding protein
MTVTSGPHAYILVTADRHLVIQELTLPPAAEWQKHRHGWLIARVAEGTGYWLQHGVSARQLAVGDGLIITPNDGGTLRASQLGPLKLQFFTIQPQHLNGVLTVAEWHQFESAPENFPASVLFFTSAELTGQKFTRLAEQMQNDRLPMRCALLQLWAGVVANLLPPVSTSLNGNKLTERFRQLVGRMTEAELVSSSPADLASRLNCSQRHFSRLFREEFGVPFRARQIESRLQHARQLLANSDSKIINIAYDSGHRHLGLFNAMFKKRFGMTPGQWRRQSSGANTPGQNRNPLPRAAVRLGIFLVAFLCQFFLTASAQTNFSPPPAVSQTRNLVRAVASLKMYEMTGEKNAGSPAAATTNALSQSAGPNRPPGFRVDKYVVLGNSILSPETIGKIFTNVPGAFGTNVTVAGIRSVLTDLQMAYRERGYATVSVALPQQKLTNATVKVQVTEGRLAAINVTGNRYYSSNDVMRALPDLKTNMLLNARVFQRELDNANLSRDRQIYPVIEPGLEPGTSDLTLKVKDQLPLHARLEVNNLSTPGTPDLRVNFNAQYDNLWDLEHQIGLQYTFTPEKLKGEEDYSATPFDDPLVANYSAYYRLPLGGYRSVQEQVDANPGSFGYNEVTHQFNPPPATGRPELTFYASRSTTDTGPQLGPKNFLTDETATNSTGVVYHPLSITTNSAGDNVTLNEDLGLKFSFPLPSIRKITATLSLGVDYKRYRQTSYDTNENFFQTEFFNQQGQAVINDFPAPQPEAAQFQGADYFPFNIGLSGSIPDKLGTTFFNAVANFTPFAMSLQGMSTIISTRTITTNTVTRTTTTNTTTKVTGPRRNYVTLQLSADRVQTIYKDWTLKIHADGQWANTRLISNEEFGMGGVAGVRGYTDGEAYGDTGWRVMLESQAPLVEIGKIGNEGHEAPCWVRGSVFMDYGEIYQIDPPAGTGGRQQFWGTGFGITVNAGNHFDARLMVACPLITTQQTLAGDVHYYFGVGIQF